MGISSTRSWLRSRLGMRESRAKERLNMARQRHRLTQVTTRWTVGDLSLGYASTIADAVTRLDDTDCQAAEQILLEMVDQDFSAGKVASFGKRIRDVIAERNGTECPDADSRRGYERSWIDSTRSLDGGRYIKGWLNAEDAAIWDGTLGPLAKPAGADDHRDLSERTAAALGSVLSGGHRATKVTVICDLDTLTGGQAPRNSPTAPRSPPNKPAASLSTQASHLSCWDAAIRPCTSATGSGSPLAAAPSLGDPLLDVCGAELRGPRDVVRSRPCRRLGSRPQPHRHRQTLPVLRMAQPFQTRQSGAAPHYEGRRRPLLLPAAPARSRAARTERPPPRLRAA